MQRSRVVTVVLATLAALLAVVAPAGAEQSPSAGHQYLPIVFVHGQSGSAQQFETQALRFTSNRYPQRLLYAFEYDTGPSTNDLEALDDFIDDVLAETGAPQVYAIGHSRGTSVWTSYLFPDEGGIDGSPKVAKYVNIDGRSPEELPGGVPTIGIWGEWNTAGSGYNRRGDTNAQIGPDPAANFYFGGKSHTEVATSAEAFAVMYEFLTGRRPATTDVVPEPPGQVRVSGRSVLFPQNEGYDGATVEVWRVRPSTGQRIGTRARATMTIDSTGDFGPVSVNGRHHYEFAVTRPEDGLVQHFYFEPFGRSDHFVRLQSSRPDEGISPFLPKGDEFVGINVIRMREFWGDQGASSDTLAIDGLNVLRPDTSPRSAVNLAVFIHDDGTDGLTDLDKGVIFPFSFIGFLTGVDVFVPASPGGEDTIAITEVARGASTAVINVPNWPSSEHRVSVQFRDHTQTREAFP
ncbi:MAG: alpha/beta hydrolase [Acidimicrobiia bacterium]|nr:alpha/beta hydrolase [Acidimicrobiia bacterium]